MNYLETNYHGTKRQLRAYLEQLEMDALRAASDRYSEMQKEVKALILKETGYDSWAKTNLPQVLAHLKPLDAALERLEKVDVKRYNTFNGNLYLLNLDQPEYVAKVMGRALVFTDNDFMRKIAADYNEERRVIRDEWLKVTQGILGRKDRIKKTCQLIESAGIDLTDYYAQVAKNESSQLPVPAIDVSLLGIKGKGGI